MSIPKDLVMYAKVESAQAYEMSKRLGIETVLSKPQNGRLYLKYDNGLSLNMDDLELKGDFRRLLPRLKKNNLMQEFLIKAAKPSVQGQLAVDATAGMGEDALLLAAAGYDVVMYEYDPVIAELLKDTISRADKTEELSDIVKRMDLKCENSIDKMPSMLKRPDVVLLDPMFPERTKSALVKKKFQLLGRLETPCSDGDALLDAAIKANPHRIIIKRPLKGGYLADKKPSYSIKGKAIRYDCIVIAQ